MGWDSFQYKQGLSLCLWQDQRPTFLPCVCMIWGVKFPPAIYFMTFQVMKPLTYSILIFAGSAVRWWQLARLCAGAHCDLLHIRIKALAWAFSTPYPKGLWRLYKRLSRGNCNRPRFAVSLLPPSAKTVHKFNCNAYLQCACVCFPFRYYDSFTASLKAAFNKQNVLVSKINIWRLCSASGCSIQNCN